MKAFKSFLILILLIGPIHLSASQLERLLFVDSHRSIQKENKKYFKRLLSKFKANQIIGIEILIAASTKRRFESRFGHALLRFVDTTPGAGDDIVLGMVADVPDQKLSYWKGLFGGYGLYPIFKNFRSFHRDYVKQEGRPLERIILVTDSTLRKSLVDTLSHWWKGFLEIETKVFEKSRQKALKKALKNAEKKFGENHTLIELKDESQRTLGFGIAEGKEASRTDLFVQARNRAVKEAAEWRSDAAYLGVKGQIIALPLMSHFLTGENPQVLSQDAFQKWGRNFALFPRFDSEGKMLGHLALPFDSSKNWQQQYFKSKLFSIEPLVITLRPKSLKNPDVGSYTFLNRNCAKALINLFKEAKFPLKKWVGLGGRIPVKMRHYFQKSFVAPYPIVTLDETLRLKSKIKKILNRDLSTPFTLEDIAPLQLLSVRERYLFLDIFSDDLPKDIEYEFEEDLINYSNDQRFSFDNIHQIASFNKQVYQPCPDSTCIQSVKMNFAKNHPGWDWSQNAKQLKKKRIKKRFKNNLELYQHLNLLAK